MLEGAKNSWVEANGDQPGYLGNEFTSGPHTPLPSTKGTLIYTVTLRTLQHQYADCRCLQERPCGPLHR